MGKGVGNDGRERGVLFKSKSGREGRCLDASEGGLDAQVASATNSKTNIFCALFGACFRCIAAEKTIEMDEKSLLPASPNFKVETVETPTSKVSGKTTQFLTRFVFFLLSVVLLQHNHAPSPARHNLHLCSKTKQRRHSVSFCCGRGVSGFLPNAARAPSPSSFHGFALLASARGTCISRARDAYTPPRTNSSLGTNQLHNHLPH